MYFISFYSLNPTARGPSNSDRNWPVKQTRKSSEPSHDWISHVMMVLGWRSKQTCWGLVVRLLGQLCFLRLTECW